MVNETIQSLKDDHHNLIMIKRLIEHINPSLITKEYEDILPVITTQIQYASDAIDYLKANCDHSFINEGYLPNGEILYICTKCDMVNRW